MLNIISQKHEIVDIKTKDEIDINYPNIVYRFPVDYFSPMTWDTHELHITNNTFAIHHFAGAWKKNNTFLERIRKLSRKFIPILKQK